MADMSNPDPEALAREVVELCADCEHCRDLMDDSVSRLSGTLPFVRPAKSRGNGTDLREYETLVDLCNFCGSGPCPNVRTEARKSKDALVALTA